MTNKTITLTVPNDDAIALHHLGEAMQRMASAHGFEAPQTVIAEAAKLPSLSGESLGQHIPAAELAEQQTVIDELEDLEPVRDIIRNAVVPEITIEERPDHDSDGTPWDERIHAESRALNADGTWRARRKPKDMEQAEWDAFVEDVKAELSGELPETPDDVEPEHAAVAPVAPPVVTPPPVVSEPVGDTPSDFISLLQWLTGNGYNSVVIDPVLKANGLANLGEVKDKPEMVSVIVEGILNSVRGGE